MDYRYTTKGTESGVDRLPRSASYRRNAAREAFVESKIRKLRLCDD